MSAEDDKQKQIEYDKLFKDEKEHPTAWSAFTGPGSAHSFSAEVFSRDEKFITAAAKKHGFKYHKFGSTISYRIPKTV